MKSRTGSLVTIFFILPAIFLFPCREVCAQLRGGVGRSDAAPASEPPGKVSGTVRRADDGSALRKAMVTLASEGRQMEAIAVRTDGSGKFEFSDVTPGRYQARVQRGANGAPRNGAHDFAGVHEI